MDEKHRERIGRGVRRAWQAKREREGARPAHVDTWILEGRVAPELAPIVKERGQQAEAMVHDLGGPQVVAAKQKALVDAPADSRSTRRASTWSRTTKSTS